jgi:hypothetical protein
MSRVERLARCICHSQGYEWPVKVLLKWGVGFGRGPVGATRT